MNKRKYCNKQNKGITLISIIVMVIVLLILAGVSITMLSGENGLITQSGNAKYQTEIAEDVEKIKALILENQLEEHKLGQELKDVQFNTTDDTTSIYDSKNGKTYGHNWYYMTPENSRELELHYSYIANYETGEVVTFEEDIHRILSNDLKCIKEGLVYAADPKNMSNGDSWGDAILHNFNEGDENSGWTEDALMFDGIDDGIEVEDSSDYSNGITIEMYFSLKGQTQNQEGQILMMKRQTTKDGFFILLGNETNGVYEYRRLFVDIGGSDNRFGTSTYVDENVPIYVTYTYDPVKENKNGILYINGEESESTNHGSIDNLVKTQENTNIQIGSDIHITNPDGDRRYPFYGEIYAARVYNRPLTEQEVKYNYDATVNK